MLSRTLLSLFVLITAFGCTNDSGDSGYEPTTDTSDLCTTPLAPNEPLCSTAFGDTAWPGSHRGSYAQGSSPLPGPTEVNTVTAEHIELPGAPIIISFSALYSDGGRAAWSTVLGTSNAVIKVDHERFDVIDTYIPAEREGADARRFHSGSVEPTQPSTVRISSSLAARGLFRSSGTASRAIGPRPSSSRSASTCPLRRFAARKTSLPGCR